MRKDIEENIYQLANDMDPSGANKKRYEDYFKSLNDKEFYLMMHRFITDKNNFIKIYYPAMSDKSPTTEFFKSIAKKRKVKLYHHIYLPHINKSENKEDAPGTVEEIMVVPLNIKRLAQTVFSKTSTSTGANDRNFETNQVQNNDKHARLSDVEVNALLAQNQYETANEYMNPRADDSSMKRQMLNDIADKGDFSMHDLKSDITNKVALNTAYYYMIGSHISTNIIEPTGLIAPITLLQKEEVKNSQVK